MEKKRSPMPVKVTLKTKHSQTATSDSDASAETNSLSADSAELTQQPNHPPKPPARKKGRRRSSEWEIMEGLKDGQKYENKPTSYSGYLHKKRKWPLKGWHKRYFLLDKGILLYGKGPAELTKGKVHGSVDIGLSVISSKATRRRLDIDAEEFIYHLKAKTEEGFNAWLDQLTVHRLYRQHVLNYGTKVISHLNTTTEDTRKMPLTPEIMSRDGSLTRGLKLGGGGARLANWLLDSGGPIEQAQRESALIELNLTQLTRLLNAIESQGCMVNSAYGETESLGEGLSPNVKKGKKFGLKKKKSSKGGSVDLTMTFNRVSIIDPDNTSPLSNNSTTGLSISPGATGNGSSLTVLAPHAIITGPQSLPTEHHNMDRHSYCAPDNQTREDFVFLAKNVLGNLKAVALSLSMERDRLKSAIEAEANVQSMSMTGGNNGTALVASLKTSLNQALQQNADLKTRLNKVHELSDINDLSSLDPVSDTHRPFNNSLSYSSSCVSGSEFFDAEEIGDKAETLHPDDIEAEIRTRGSDSSSEAGSLSSGEGSISSESELGGDYNQNSSSVVNEGNGGQGLTGRRTILPAPRPGTEGLSLWNLLCKNIGKDLSQISMPVALNEPLNMLQRLCEELEYSELLDKAAELDDPYERMIQVAAFAVSSYANSYSRAGNKPFNPLLGETYECIREDKGFKFLAEQVSHHPPISACHAESRNFTFWQEARIKTKFWGKSMEFQPVGKVHVLLPRTGDLYSWNKVTTCVHNLFSGQRWVDQYGELHISNGRISCKLTFAKASYWSAKRQEVLGAVYDENGKTVCNLFGKWSEALYCGVAPSAKCIWRAGTMPPDHERYYGFTRFAMELNELGPDSHLLPPTDTRLRPDQRALEEGDLNAAEQLKLQLESQQRDRRKHREESKINHEPLWFSHRAEDKDDVWEYNGKYWEARKNGAYSNMTFEELW
ncbi:PREDICTED: oxysterol-binding protein-related protein 3-like [Nicrophorus vespilloides]|uniref:Oxysterol-binding protein n=1 Tax=Nicrophorus vespilloides TaxID=110193 RepID=A0ABM1MXN8_NICVS|nr:PREDICTED: oxysterol-binding protein-related protein 3-like [Nicrophorus vespilloides]